MKHNYTAELDDIRIRQIEKTDIELLRLWRNSIDSSFLRNIGHITEEMQIQWYNNYLIDEQVLFFAIDDIGEINHMVGSLALYNWDKEAEICEIGKIIIGDPKAHGKGIGRKTLVMAMKIAFQRLGIKKIMASVHPNNPQAYHNDMTIGFRVVGEVPSVAGGNELLLEITEEIAQKVNIYYGQIII